MKQIRAEAFAAKYIQHNCCGARALRALGAKGSVQSLSTQAAQLLKKLEVQAALSAIRKEIAMDAPDVVGRMSDMARASLEDFLNRDGRVDLAKARRLGKLHLARKVRIETRKADDGSEIVNAQVELYDAQAALKTMMEYHGLLSDILELRKVPKAPCPQGCVRPGHPSKLLIYWYAR